MIMLSNNNILLIVLCCVYTKLRPRRLVCNNIEPNSLGQRTALSDGDNITLLHSEGRRAMDSDILVSLLKTTVLGNVVKVVPTYNNGALHLGGDDLSVEDTPADGYVSGERTLLVYEGSLDSSIGGLNSKTDITGETHALLALGANNALTSYEDSVLALAWSHGYTDPHRCNLIHFFPIAAFIRIFASLKCHRESMGKSISASDLTATILRQFL
eukprot:scaffold1851_cov252-Chaetoceros_neogracile.AAC.2